jgi:hypothetical protein
MIATDAHFRDSFQVTTNTIPKSPSSLSLSSSSSSCSSMSSLRSYDDFSAPPTKKNKPSEDKIDIIVDN